MTSRSSQNTVLERQVHDLVVINRFPLQCISFFFPLSKEDEYFDDVKYEWQFIRKINI